MLLDLEKFVKGLTLVREIPSEFFGQLADVPLSRAPLYIAALVKASFSAPERFVQGSKARVFSPADLAAISSKLEDNVKKAHTIMQEARTYLSKVGVLEEPRAHQLVGALLDVRLVMHVHAKHAQGRVAFKSQTEIAIAFRDAVVKEYGERAAAVPSPWVLVALADKAQKRMRPLRELKVSAEHVQQDGFVVGAKIVNKRKETVTIKEFGMHEGVESVVLKNKDGEETVIHCSELLDTCKLAEETVQERDARTTHACVA